MEQWKRLLNSIQVVGEGGNACTQDMLDQCEAVFGIRLPLEYKEYALIFGRGNFGYSHSIFVPGPSVLRSELIRRHSTMTSAVRGGLSEEAAGGGRSAAAAKTMLAVLQNCLLFGQTANTALLVWDLRTYSDADRAADIYMMVGLEDDYRDARMCPLGRSFYRLMSEILLGATPVNDACLPDNFEDYRSAWHEEGRQFITNSW